VKIDLPCQFEIEVEYEWDREPREASSRAHVLFDGEVIWTSGWEYPPPYDWDGDEISAAKDAARDRLIERLGGLLA
jgi:hypothetical protein